MSHKLRLPILLIGAAWLLLTISIGCGLTGKATAGQADLEIEISGPVSAMPGDKLAPKIQLSVTNVGTGPAKAKYNVELVLSTDKTVPKGYARYSSTFKEDALLAGGRLTGNPALPPGDDIDLSFTLARIANDTTLGSYYLCARVDTFNVVKESDESDNSNVSCVPIEITGTTPISGLKAPLGTASLYWAARDAIFRVGLDSVPVEIASISDPPDAMEVVPNAWIDDNGKSQSTGHIRGIAVDTEKGLVYWTNYKYGTIGRGTLVGKNLDAALISNIGSPWGIALDQTNNTLYWTDPINGRVQRANLDDSAVVAETLFSKEAFPGEVKAPFGIALDPINSMLYWTDDGTNSIQRAPLNKGKVGQLEIIVEGVESLRDIVLDVANDRMYWATKNTHKIQNADLDGNSVQDMALPLVVTIPVPNKPHDPIQYYTRPVWLALDTAVAKIYWAQTDLSVAAIKRANFDASAVEVLVSFDKNCAASGCGYPQGIVVVYGSAIKP